MLTEAHRKDIRDIVIALNDSERSEVLEAFESTYLGAVPDLLVWEIVEYVGEVYDEIHR